MRVSAKLDHVAGRVVLRIWPRPACRSPLALGIAGRKWADDLRHRRPRRWCSVCGPEVDQRGPCPLHVGGWSGEPSSRTKVDSGATFSAQPASAAVSASALKAGEGAAADGDGGASRQIPWALARAELLSAPSGWNGSGWTRWRAESSAGWPVCGKLAIAGDINVDHRRFSPTSPWPPVALPARLHPGAGDVFVELGGPPAARRRPDAGVCLCRADAGGLGANQGLSYNGFLAARPAVLVAQNCIWAVNKALFRRFSQTSACWSLARRIRRSQMATRKILVRAGAAGGHRRWHRWLVLASTSWC